MEIVLKNWTCEDVQYSGHSACVEQRFCYNKHLIAKSKTEDDMGYDILRADSLRRQHFTPSNFHYVKSLVFMVQYSVSECNGYSKSARTEHAYNDTSPRIILAQF